MQLSQGYPKVGGNTCGVLAVVFVGWAEEPHIDA